MTAGPLYLNLSPSSATSNSRRCHRDNLELGHRGWKERTNANGRGPRGFEQKTTAATAESAARRRLYVLSLSSNFQERDRPSDHAAAAAAVLFLPPTNKHLAISYIEQEQGTPAPALLVDQTQPTCHVSLPVGRALMSSEAD